MVRSAPRRPSSISRGGTRLRKLHPQHLQTATAWQANSEIKRLIDQAEQSVEVLIQGASAIGLSGDLSVRIDEQEPPQPGTHGTSTPWPSIESIPEQERTGTRFGMDGQGRIDVLQTPPTIDELQRLHYEEMRHKAQALSDLGQMLGDLAQDTFRILRRIAGGDRGRGGRQALVARQYAAPAPQRACAHIDMNLGPDPARLRWRWSPESSATSSIASMSM